MAWHKLSGFVLVSLWLGWGASVASAAGWLNFLGLGSDCHTYLDDARGLKSGAAVEWRGLDVGIVTTVRPADGRIRVDVDFARDYRKRIPSGVKAWPRVNLLKRETSLRLVDASGVGDAMLGRGSEVPAAAWYETVTKHELLLAGGAVVGIVLVVLILKGIKKLLFIICVGAVLFGGCVWVRQQLSGASARDAERNECVVEADRLIEKLRASPDGAAVADKIQGALAHALERVREEGPGAWARARAEVERLLQTESAELREGGKSDTADDVGRIKALVGKLLPGDSEAEK